MIRDTKAAKKKAEISQFMEVQELQFEKNPKAVFVTF